MNGGSEIVGAALLFLGRAGNWMRPRDEREDLKGGLERTVTAEEAPMEAACQPQFGLYADVGAPTATHESAAPERSKTTEIRNPDYASKALDLLPQAIFAIDRTRRVLWLNAHARALTEGGEDLRIYHGRLCCLLARNQLKLDSLVSRSLENPLAVSSIGTVATSLDCHDGRTLALLLRAPSSPANVAVGGETASDPDARPLYLVASHSDRALPIPERALCELYGLTPAEARVAAAIASGRSLRDYAPAAGIALSTARLQLSRVLSKTGANRQADLVRLLLSSPTALFADAAEPLGKRDVQ